MYHYKSINAMCAVFPDKMLFSWILTFSLHDIRYSSDEDPFSCMQDSQPMTLVKYLQLVQVTFLNTLKIAG